MAKLSSSSSIISKPRKNRRLSQFLAWSRPRRVPPAPTAGGVYARMEVATHPGISILNPASNLPPHKCLPKVLRALVSVPKSAAMWGLVRPTARTPPPSAADVRRAAQHLLSLLSGVLLVNASSLGWVHNNKGCPFKNCLAAAVGGGVLEPVCMPVSAAAVAASPYMQVHKGGYLRLYFGQQHSRGSTAKKRAWECAHVILCWLFHGAPPSPTPRGRYEAGHVCGHASCLCPAHLQWCTHAENGAMMSWHAREGRGRLFPLAAYRRGEEV